MPKPAIGGTKLLLPIASTSRSYGNASPVLSVVRNPVQLRDQLQLKELLAQIRIVDPHPLALFLDTFARMFVGGDENSSKEVGEFVERARQLQRE